MKISLISLPITEGNPTANLKTIQQLIGQAAADRPDMICFPEMSVVNDGPPWGRYRHLADTIPGQYTEILRRLAQQYKIHLSVGLLESDHRQYYSSAILIDPVGRIILKHRQIKNGPPYSCGTGFTTAQTHWGSIMFAICADVWCEQLIPYLIEHQPDYLIIPADICDDEPDNGTISDVCPPGNLAALKDRYREISQCANARVLIINAYNLNSSEPNSAYGGTFVFDCGREIDSHDLQINQWRQPVNRPIYRYSFESLTGM